MSMWVYVSTGFSLSFDRLHPSKNAELFSIFFFFGYRGTLATQMYVRKLSQHMGFR